MFSNGKIIVIGGKTEEEARQVLDMYVAEFADLGHPIEYKVGLRSPKFHGLHGLQWSVDSTLQGRPLEWSVERVEWLGPLGVTWSAWSDPGREEIGLS